jgi:hypothetical protein
MAVGSALFWVEDESPPRGNFSPGDLGGAMARMLAANGYLFIVLAGPSCPSWLPSRRWIR